MEDTDTETVLVSIYNIPLVLNFLLWSETTPRLQSLPGALLKEETERLQNLNSSPEATDFNFII